MVQIHLLQLIRLSFSGLTQRVLACPLLITVLKASSHLASFCCSVKINPIALAKRLTVTGGKHGEVAQLVEQCEKEMLVMSVTTTAIFIRYQDKHLMSVRF